MILDSEQQRDALLQLMKTATFSGDQIEFVYALHEAIKRAHVPPEQRRAANPEGRPPAD